VYGLEFLLSYGGTEATQKGRFDSEFTYFPSNFLYRGGRRRFSGLRVAHGGTPRPRPLIAAVVGAAAAAAAAADSADSDGAVAAAGFDSLLVFVF
jgi:hypothetical protein